MKSILTFSLLALFFTQMAQADAVMVCMRESHAGTKTPRDHALRSVLQSQDGQVQEEFTTMHDGESVIGLRDVSINKVAPRGYGYLLDMTQTFENNGVVKKTVAKDSMQSRIVCEHSKYGNYFYNGVSRTHYTISSVAACKSALKLLDSKEGTSFRIVTSEDNLVLTISEDGRMLCNRTVIR